MLGDIRVTKLKLLKANHTSQRYRLEDCITKNCPKEIAALKEKINGMEEDIRTAEANFPANPEQFFMKIGDKVYTDKKEAGTALVEICKEIKTAGETATVGEYAGFKMMISFDVFENCFMMNLKGQLSHKHALGVAPLGNITRINHAVESMPKQLAEAQTKLVNVEKQLETAKVEVLKPFAQEEEPDDYRVVQKSGQMESIFKKPEMETKVADASVPYPAGNAGYEHMENHGNLQKLKPAESMIGKPAQRVSLKERLEAFRLKVTEAKKQEKHMEKKKEEVL